MSKQSKRYNNIYLSAKDTYSTFSNKEKISYSSYQLIYKTFFYLLSKSIIDEGKIYYLPQQMGTVGVYKINKTKKMIDFDLYKKTGIKTNIRNLHTHGAMVKFYWQTVSPWYKINNVGSPAIYRFKACRANSRYLAKQVKENNTLTKYYDY